MSGAKGSEVLLVGDVVGASVGTTVDVEVGTGVRVGVGTPVAVGTAIDIAVGVGVGTRGLGVTVSVEVAPAWQAARNSTRNQHTDRSTLHNLMKLGTSLGTLGNNLMRHLPGRDR
ncbi:MAG: hypothetical protein QGI09_03070 [Dehalococcoidia bacterium]|jgi:hypothetical protein|nr:hypothetical protein [Dehalococcoidia bacterium]